ncbi:MAG: hypothetical protein JO300_15180 [Silvibacterium sp.]|nr:hypothetical protein [Silvibacterium sp.]
MSSVLPRRFLLIACFTCLMIATGPGHAATPSPVCGTWRGNSECVQSDSPCHDEVNVYRFAEIPGKPNTFSGSGSKIVDGKEIEMGTLEWTFDPQYHALEAEVFGNTFRLIVMGNKMEGTLKIGNNVIYRRIHLQRAPN